MRLTRKELRETLRDRRTVITLVLMPLLVYPLLSISFNKSLLISAEEDTDIVYRIGVDSEKDADLLGDLLTQGEQLLNSRQSDPTQNASQSQQRENGQTAFEPKETAELTWFPGESLERHVSNLDIPLAVRIRYPPAKLSRRTRFQPVSCQLIYRRTSAFSERAMRFVEDRLMAVNVAVLRSRVARMGNPAILTADVTRKPISAGQQAPFSLATLVPLILILMTITGAVYPAIDLTAGERERGTLETLIAAPISRMALLIAKYTAVLVVAVLTAMVNLLAMTVTVLTSSLGRELFPHGISPTLIAEIFGLLILFAAFFSAILLALTSFARSFKEAQAYLIPVMLLAISPGLLSLMPGIELNGLLAVTPLVNIVLLSRDMLEGGANPAMAALAITSTLVYAAVAIGVASKIFGNDALLYASRGSWSDLFRRPAAKLTSPTTAATILCLALMFPCFFWLANLVQSSGDDLGRQLLLNALVTVVVFGFVPLIFAIVQRVELVAGFQIRRAPLVSFLGAFVLGVALWPFAHEIFLVGKWIGLASLDETRFEALGRLLDTFRALPTPLVLITLSLVPAVLEEFFFRGYLFNGLRSRFPGRGVIVVSSLLFGLFHVLSPHALTPERFLPSTFMGLFLGWVCYRTSSVLPGMLLHVCHNGILMLIVQNRDSLTAQGWIQEGREHLPAAWLIGAGLVVLIGLGMIFLATRPGDHGGQQVDDLVDTA